MANFPAVPTNTTLSAALDANSRSVPLTSASGMVADALLVVGQELMLINSVDTTNNICYVQRGFSGTKAKKHESGSLVYYGAKSVFAIDEDRQISLTGYDGDFGKPVLPIGSYWTDPDTGYEYLLCDTGAAFEAGEWAIISAAGAAAAMTNTGKGRVGLCTEAVGASDKVAWFLVRGTYASAMMTSDVTTGATLATGTNSVDLWSSANGYRIFGATCTTAPSTATSPTYGGGLGTVYLNHPWAPGVDDYVS